MRAVIQRVKSASVKINGQIKSSVESGLLVFLGIEKSDTNDDADWLSRKISGLRIFDDANSIMNLDIKQSGGSILIISQFTLHAKTKKGNRPSYIEAAAPDQAIPLYHRFVQMVTEYSGTNVRTGEFGAEMDIELINHGPVTIFIDSRNKE
jgi:D-aminoacyl-tRNA deacylase